MKKAISAKRLLALLLASVSLLGVFTFTSTPVSAATSSTLATEIKSLLPLQCYAMPSNGASRIYAYSYSNGKLGSQQKSYWIGSFSEQIVVTDISNDGAAVKVRYLSSSGQPRDKWFRTDDVLGLSNVSLADFQANASMTVYRMSSSYGVTRYGSISKGDDLCYKLGDHKVGSIAYNTVIYQLSSGATVNGVWVKYKMGLVKQSEYNAYAKVSSNEMVDVTSSFAGKTIRIRSAENNKYLCADDNWYRNCYFNRSVASTWETFRVSALTSDQYVGIQAYNGKWLSARKDVSNVPLRAVADKLQAYECFRIYQQGNNYFLKAQANSKYLCVRVDKDNSVGEFIATTPSTWERLEIEVVSTETTIPSFDPIWPCQSSFLVSTVYFYYNNGNTARHGSYSNSTNVDGYLNAIDITGPGGDILAVEDGTVEYAQWRDGGFGYTIIILHKNGQRSLYGHLKEGSLTVKMGDPVCKNQVIAQMGSSGNSDGLHLHFEMWGVDASGNATIVDPFMTYYAIKYKEKIKIGDVSPLASKDAIANGYRLDRFKTPKAYMTPFAIARVEEYLRILDQYYKGRYW